mmetsp:Transcript_17016/g.40777  ORF Transcript_17016/g.40777 Transcript_17016/m.40777 type:complete len:158 (-) Transcript_17016:403-876(-)
MITLAKGFTAKFAPDIACLAIQSLLLLQRKCTLHGSLNVSTGKSKTEPSLRITDEVEGDFRKAFGLQVGNNSTATESGVLDHVHDLSILFIRKGKLEPSFSCVNANDSGPGFPIKAKQLILNNPGGIDGMIQRTDSTRVASRKTILNMVKSGIDKEV